MTSESVWVREILLVELKVLKDRVGVSTRFHGGGFGVLIGLYPTVCRDGRESDQPTQRQKTVGTQ